jgi:2-keto-4-pentenoate hydratase/2-oxohepta-3-ene-1,7-dioic acid hydratase in catechol pathway
MTLLPGDVIPTGTPAGVAPNADNLARNHRSEQPDSIQPHRLERARRKLRPRVFLKRRQQPLDPQRSVALYNFPILRPCFSQKTAIPHLFLPSLLR